MDKNKKVIFTKKHLKKVDSDIEDLVGEPIEEKDDAIVSLKDLALAAFSAVFTKDWYKTMYASEELMKNLGLYLPTDLDILKVAIVLGNENIYWKRITEERWPNEFHDKYQINNNWKNYFLEKFLGEYIDRVEPNNVDYSWLKILIKILAPYIIKLKITELKIGPNDTVNNESCDTEEKVNKFSVDKDKGKLKNKKEKNKDKIVGGMNKVLESMSGEAEDESGTVVQEVDKPKMMVINEDEMDRILKQEDKNKKKSTEELYQGLKEKGDPWTENLLFGYKCKCTSGPNARVHLGTFISLLPFLSSLTISFGFINYSYRNAFNYADIDNKEFFCFITCLTKLANLRHLKINYSKLDHEKIRIISVCCKYMNVLEILELTNCTITDDCMVHLKDMFRGASPDRIKKLNLSGNFITFQGVRVLTDGLINAPLPRIRYLDLSRNMIGSKGVGFIAKAIVKNPNIDSVILCHVGMGTTGIIDLSQAIFNCVNLKHLDTSCNKISDRASKHILEAVKKNSSLETWYLGESGLDENLLKEVKERLLQNRVNKISNEFDKYRCELLDYTSDKERRKKKWCLPGVIEPSQNEVEDTFGILK